MYRRRGSVPAALMSLVIVCSRWISCAKLHVSRDWIHRAGDTRCQKFISQPQEDICVNPPAYGTQLLAAILVLVLRRCIHLLTPQPPLPTPLKVTWGNPMERRGLESARLSDPQTAFTIISCNTLYRRTQPSFEQFKVSCLDSLIDSSICLSIITLYYIYTLQYYNTRTYNRLAQQRRLKTPRVVRWQINREMGVWS